MFMVIGAESSVIISNHDTNIPLASLSQSRVTLALIFSNWHFDFKKISIPLILLSPKSRPKDFQSPSKKSQFV